MRVPSLLAFSVLVLLAEFCRGYLDNYRGEDSLLAMYETKCHNNIVGLFCQGYGCYYNSDCFDGYCNMYSKCQ